MGSRVLVADDHEMVRRGIRSLLEASHRDIQVLEACDGREAIEKTIGLKPDLVILDISMPNLDGLSAAREIKKVAAGTPILILTFEKSMALTETAKSIGVSGYITKGESSETLLRAIDAALGSPTGQKTDGDVFRPPFMDTPPQSRNIQMKEDSTRPRAETGRPAVLRVLLLHSRIEYVERCLQEFADVQFQIEADVVLTSEQCRERLRSRFYDILLAEYPTPKWQTTPTPDLLRSIGRNIPVIFVGRKMEQEAVADLISKGAADCVEMDNFGQLPIAIRRALKENTFRAERKRVERKLQHSEARYRALTGNLAFGICRCRVDGRFVDVNEALVAMVGYESKEELLGSNLAAEILRDPPARAQLLGEAGANGRIDPLETDWRRKDGTVLTVRLSGREVNADNGKRDGYEIIVEDVTKQRELEDHLRQQAARDPLTGLANYRHLLAVLGSEINRFDRTGREFALLLFDMDGLKQINDRHGHLTGSESLCRLAEVLAAGCRNIDTAARFGGDEFAVVLPETGAEAAKSVAQRLCNNLADESREPKLTMSAGVAIYPTDGDTVESLLLAADRALYERKSVVHGGEHVTHHGA
jgi:diguanylate cyclase (GGDEF)-like protein/PAS domain S-box-containing protein